jgi:hypothetical protein
MVVMVVRKAVVRKVPAQEVGFPLLVPILAARSGPVQGEKEFKLPHSALIKFFFLIYKEIGAVAKSYMGKGFIIYEEMREYFPYMRRSLVIYDFSTAPL